MSHGVLKSLQVCLSHASSMRRNKVAWCYLVSSVLFLLVFDQKWPSHLFLRVQSIVCWQNLEKSCSPDLYCSKFIQPYFSALNFTLSFEFFYFGGRFCFSKPLHHGWVFFFVCVERRAHSQLSNRRYRG